MSGEILEINVGPLSSFNSLNLYIGPQLTKLRNDYMHGRQTIPIWDLRHISPKAASISALVAFLSISKRIRDFIGKPIEVKSYWQPEFQGFLADIGFIHIAQYFDLYDWGGHLGGFVSGKTNPNTKIFFYSDLPGDFKDQDEVNDWKDLKRQEIKHSLLLRLSNLFDSKTFQEHWTERLEAVLTITSAELIVNSLLHGNDVAFVGVQRTSKRISACVCDSGIGFPKSMRKNHRKLMNDSINHCTALMLASLLSKNKIGLYRAIDDVIATGGHVIFSSFDAEIRWQEEIWNNALTALNEKGLEGISLNDLGEPTEGFMERENIEKGYYKNYKTFLIGSRITFEIPL